MATWKYDTTYIFCVHFYHASIRLLSLIAFSPIVSCFLELLNRNAVTAQDKSGRHLCLKVEGLATAPSLLLKPPALPCICEKLYLMMWLSCVLAVVVHNQHSVTRN
jgi:hypothetical protein